MDSALKSLITHLRTALEAPYSPGDTLTTLPSFSLGLLTQNPPKATEQAYAQLYASPFHAVPTKWRRLYEESRLWSALKILEAVTESSSIPSGEQWEDKVIEHCDMALIMTGAPARRSLIDEILHLLREPDSSLKIILADEDAVKDEEVEAGPPSKRRRLEPRLPAHYLSVPPIFAPSSGAIPRISQPVQARAAPSLQSFTAHISDLDPQPLLITSALNHWTALTRWKSPRYWMHRTHAGRRRVPVEFGKSYVDEGWGQGIIPFGDILREQLVDAGEGLDIELPLHDDGGENDPVEKAADDKSKQRPTQAKKRKGYLAQHDLLSQIPALRKDISVPDYCYCQRNLQDKPIDPTHAPNQLRAENIQRADHNPKDDTSTTTTITTSEHNNDNDTDETTKPDPLEGNEDTTSLYSDTTTASTSTTTQKDPIHNMWLGPACTVSPAHTDPHDNLFAQIIGRKYIRLYHPAESNNLYPMGIAYHKVPAQSSSSSSAAPNERVNVEARETKEYSMANTSSLDIGLEVIFDDEEDMDGQITASGKMRAKERDIQRVQRPGLAEARYVECIIQPGELLYIPKGWWHYVRSLDVSASVSFWW